MSVKLNKIEQLNPICLKSYQVNFNIRSTNKMYFNLYIIFNTKYYTLMFYEYPRVFILKRYISHDNHLNIHFLKRK